jgi:hypothetical protein
MIAEYKLRRNGNIALSQRRNVKAAQPRFFQSNSSLLVLVLASSGGSARASSSLVSIQLHAPRLLN